MGITTDWHNPEKTAIRYYFFGEWTWDLLFSEVDKAVEMLNTVEHPVVLIVDMRDNVHIPTISLMALSRLANLPTMSHPRTAYLVLVGAQMFVKTTFDVFRRMFPSAAARYRLADSLTEVDAMLNSPAAT